ncbi:hypothetical protein PSHT_10557, partial [Puccinia striiformis]
NSSNNNNNNPDRWKTQRRKEAFVTQIERIRENNLKHREGIYTKACKIRLHRESLGREQELLAVRVYHDHLISATRAAFDAEVRSIEKSSQMQGLKPREITGKSRGTKKKLKDEKELIDFNEEAVGLRNRGSNRTSFPRGSPGLGSTTTYSNQLDGPLANNPDPTEADLGTSIHTHSRRAGPGPATGSRRAPTGLPGPISLTSITPGTWNNFHKSQLGICPAKNDDTDADLDQIRNLAGLLSPKT